MGICEIHLGWIKDTSMRINGCSFDSSGIAGSTCSGLLCHTTCPAFLARNRGDALTKD